MIDDRLDGDLQGRRGLFQRSVEERGRLAGQHGVGREGVHAALVNELGLRELLVLHHGNDKLAEALAKNPVDEKELCDLGLRYDLTLPLSRYYANNRNSLHGFFSR